MNEENVINWLVVGLLLAMNIGVFIGAILFSED